MLLFGRPLRLHRGLEVPLAPRERGQESAKAELFGFGGAIDLAATSSSGNKPNAAKIEWWWVANTHASRKGGFAIYVDGASGGRRVLEFLNGGDYTLTLQDNAGATEFNVVNSDDEQLVTINSAGESLFSGIVDVNIGVGDAGGTDELHETAKFMASKSGITPANGFGGYLDLAASHTETEPHTLAQLQWWWENATEATRRGALGIYLGGASGGRRVLELLNGGDYTLTLQDNAGAQKLSIADSDDVEVASIDSEGKAIFKSADIGDGTNEAQFAADGELTLAGTARVKRDIWIPADGLRAPGTKPAELVDHGISKAWQFTDGTDDTVVGTFKLPNDMDKTVAPSMIIGWSSNTADPGDDSKQVVWQLEYLYTQAGEDTTAAAQETLSVTASSSTTSDGLVVSEFTGVDVPHADDVCCHWRLKRLGDDGDDDLGDTAELHGVCLCYTSDKLGTAT